MYAQPYNHNKQHRPRYQRRNPPAQTPSVDQISQLYNNVFQSNEYDPEKWSILDEHEQERIQRIVYSIPLFDLSIRNVLHDARLTRSPSREQFIQTCIRKRFTYGS